MTDEAAPHVLEPLLNDASIREIMINGPGQVFVERKGKLEPVEGLFQTSNEVLECVQLLLHPLGARLYEQKPTADFRLPDGTRISVALPPVALNGPCVTIRKPFHSEPTVEQLIGWGSITQEVAELLQACMRARLNVLMSGGTGSGRTTMLNILTEFIPADERLVTVEEVAEFQVRHHHVVSLQSHPADSSGAGSVTMRDLIRTASRLRPERVLFGELSGAEALDALQLMQRGHDGSMITIHANDAEEALERLAMLLVFNLPGAPVYYVPRLIGSSLDLVVQQNRLPDGSRKVTGITEVVPDRQEGYTLRDIAVFKQTGLNERGGIAGAHQVYPLSERLAQRLRNLHITLPPPFMLPDSPQPTG